MVEIGDTRLRELTHHTFNETIFRRISRNSTYSHKKIYINQCHIEMDFIVYFLEIVIRLTDFYNEMWYVL